MPFDLLNNNSGFGQNLVQSPNWPLVQGLKPWVCSPDGVFFSLSHLCCGQNRFQENHSISNQSGERTKESSAIVTLALYNLQVSMRCDITNKRPQTKKKKNIAISASFCHLWKEAPVMLKSQRRVAIWSDSEYSSPAYALILSSQWLPVSLAKSHPENQHSG